MINSEAEYNQMLSDNNEYQYDNQREMKIKLIPYDHTCADGCCYTTGYDVFVNGEKIGHTIGEDAMELAELLNETFKTKEK